MRARYPDQDGFVDVGGVKIAYEVYGDGPRTVVFPPIDTIVHSRAWKAQIPFLARHARVVVIDPRGNGRSDRPADPDRYRDLDFVDDTIAVMDAVGVERGLLVGICSSGWVSLVTAARHPERVTGVVSIATWAPYLTPPSPWRAGIPFDVPLDNDEGWNKDNKYYWLRDWQGYLEFFFGELLSEAHSSKAWEDAVGWGLETTPEAVIAHDEAEPCVADREESLALLHEIRCPVLTIHGDSDRCQPQERSEIVAAQTGGRHVSLAGAGHLPQARHPVVVNRLPRGAYTVKVVVTLANGKKLTEHRRYRTCPTKG